MAKKQTESKICWKRAGSICPGVLSQSLVLLSHHTGPEHETTLTSSFICSWKSQLSFGCCASFAQPLREPMRASSALLTSFHMPKPSQLGIFRLSFGTGALFLPTSRSRVFCISFGGFQNAQPAPEQKQRCKSICKFSSKPRKKDQASQSIHMSIISAWEGLCGSSQQALCVHALHGQATISIRPRKRAGSHCISLTSGGKWKCTQGGKLQRCEEALDKEKVCKERTCTQTEHLHNSRGPPGNLKTFSILFSPALRVDEQSHLTQATLASMLTDCASAQILQWYWLETFVHSWS